MPLPIDSYPGGLSPRVRGNHDQAPPHCPGRRSIPASAGQPSSTVSPGLLLMVYPCECGATGYPAQHHQSGKGLSPRVRGNPQTASQATYRAGSIPASAGQPSSGGARTRLRQVYPRECGATIKSLQSISYAVGLSPRVRGNHLQIGLGRLGIGLNEVYPRECGAT